MTVQVVMLICSLSHIQYLQIVNIEPSNVMFDYICYKSTFVFLLFLLPVPHVDDVVVIAQHC